MLSTFGVLFHYRYAIIFIVSLALVETDSAKFSLSEIMGAFASEMYYATLMWMRLPTINHIHWYTWLSIGGNGLRIALQDSPAGLASYILDRMMIFTNPANKLDPDGGMKKYYTYDQLLDNIMLYWVSGSITTSMRIYKEIFEDSAMEKMIELIPTTVPTWGARFKNDLAYTPDFLLKWKYPNLLGTSNYNVGGHLAAFERPKEFSESVFQAAKAFLAFSK